MGAVLATQYDGGIVELQQIRWNEDLTAAQRGAIASNLEKARSWATYEYVSPKTLYVDERYQRPISMTQVWDITKNFDPMLFDPLWIGERKDGKRYVIDGRHRLAATMTLGLDLIPQIPIQVRKTTGVEEEARIYVLLSEKRRKMSSAQRFAAKLVYGDPMAVDLQKIMAQHGFKVPTDKFGSGGSRQRGDNEITAVGTLEAIYKVGGSQRVSNVLYIVRNAWDAEPPSTEQKMLLALNGLLERTRLAPSTIARKLAMKNAYGLFERGVGHSHRAFESTGTVLAESEGVTNVLQTIVEAA
jgi:hypothetical protein